MSEQIRRVVLEALGLYAERPLPEKADHLRPIEDLGFDSQDGVAVACELSEQLEFDIPNEINPLVNDEEKRGRTIQEIVEFISTLEAGQRNK